MSNLPLELRAALRSALTCRYSAQYEIVGWSFTRVKNGKRGVGITTARFLTVSPALFFIAS